MAIRENPVSLAQQEKRTAQLQLENVLHYVEAIPGCFAIPTGKLWRTIKLYQKSDVITKASVGEEPGAGNPHAGICGGAGEQSPVLR